MKDESDGYNEQSRDNKEKEITIDVINEKDKDGEKEVKEDRINRVNLRESMKNEIHLFPQSDSSSSPIQSGLFAGNFDKNIKQIQQIQEYQAYLLSNKKKMEEENVPKLNFIEKTKKGMDKKKKRGTKQRQSKKKSSTKQKIRQVFYDIYEIRRNLREMLRKNDIVPPEFEVKVERPPTPPTPPTPTQKEPCQTFFEESKYMNLPVNMLKVSYIQVNPVSLTLDKNHVAGQPVSEIKLDVWNDLRKSLYTALSSNVPVNGIKCSGRPDFEDHEIRAISSWNLRHHLVRVDFSACPTISDEGVSELAIHCNNLRSINFNNCIQLTDNSLSLFPKYCPFLQIVRLKYCIQITNHFLMELSNKTKLYDGINENAQKYGKKIIRFIPQENSEGFHQNQHSDNLDNQLEEISSNKDKECFVFMKWRSLLELDLTGLPLITDRGLRQVIECQPKLSRLILDHCEKVSGEMFCFEHLLKAGLTLRRSLNDISLANVPKLKREASIWLASSNEFLHNINLAALNTLRDAEMIQIVYHCRHLLEINVSGCDMLTDRSIHTIYDLIGSQLEVINISGCLGLTNSSISKILRKSPSLKSFKCNKMPQLGINSILLPDEGSITINSSSTVIVSTMPNSLKFKSNDKLSITNLEHLELVGTNILNRESGELLARNMRAVRILKIGDNFDLTTDTLLHIIRFCGESLRELDIGNCLNTVLNNETCKNIAMYCLNLEVLNIGLPPPWLLPYADDDNYQRKFR